MLIHFNMLMMSSNKNETNSASVKRIANLKTKEMLHEVNDIINAKDNTHASIAIRKQLTRKHQSKS